MRSQEVKGVSFKEAKCQGEGIREHACHTHHLREAGQCLALQGPGACEQRVGMERALFSLHPSPRLPISL